MGVCQKLQPTFLGPFVTTRKSNDLIFNIHLGPNDSRVVYHNKLKKYEGEGKNRMGDYAIKEAEDTVSILSYSNYDYTDSSKQVL